MAQNRDGTMTVLEHLAELRVRLLIIAVCLLAAVVFCYTQIDWICRLLTGPLNDMDLIYLSPPEAFIANLRMAFVSGVALAAPVILYQIAAFVFPGLYRREKIFFCLVLIGFCILFCTGVLFAFFVAFPMTLNFFLRFSTADLEAEFTISAYLSFIITFHLAFGLVFQLPLFTWALARVGIISSQFLRRNRKFALFIMLIIAAVITPPDVVSQIIMTGPMLLLYEIGIVMVVLCERKRIKLESAEIESV